MIQFSRLQIKQPRLSLCTLSQSLMPGQSSRNSKSSSSYAEVDLSVYTKSAMNRGACICPARSWLNPPAHCFLAERPKEEDLGISEAFHKPCMLTKRLKRTAAN